jgi:hypothetical protein
MLSKLEEEWSVRRVATHIQGDSEKKLKKKPVIGDDEVIDKNKISYKSFFVFEIQMIENLLKIASTLLS